VDIVDRFKRCQEVEGTIRSHIKPLQGQKSIKIKGLKIIESVYQIIANFIHENNRKGVSRKCQQSSWEQSHRKTNEE